MAITQTNDKEVAKIVSAMGLAEKYTTGHSTILDFLQNFVDAYEVINDLTRSGGNALSAKNTIAKIKARSSGSDESQG